MDDREVLLMRANVRDVMRHPTWIASWWLDWPCRHLHFWRLLLFEPGQGWLRWGTDERVEYWDIGTDFMFPEPYLVVPPLRRFLWNVATIVAWLLNRQGLRDDAPFTWAAGAGFYRDKDRKRELWER